MSFSVYRKIFGRPLSQAFCINAVMLALSFLFGAKYSSLDDYFMHSVLTGAYGGEYDVHLYFINVVYGYFLWPFYKLIPSFGWYSFFETLAMFASFTAISYVLLQKLRGRGGLLFTILTVACVSPEFYFHVAFTQCAAALTAAGFLLLVVGGKDDNKKQLVIAVLMMAAGSVFRREMFLLVVPAIALSLGIVLLRERKIHKSLWVALLCCFAVVGAFKEVNALHYLSDGYDYYAAYQPMRSMYGDGAFYDDDDVLDELEERSGNSRDYRYLKSWYYYDKDVFSIDSLKSMGEVIHRNAFVPNYAKFPVAIFAWISLKLGNPIVWCWLILCLAIIAFSHKRNGAVPWLSVALLGIPYAYLLLVNRVVDHVESGIWLYAVVFVIPFLEVGNIYTQKYGSRFCKAIVLISIVGFALPIVMQKITEYANPLVLTKTIPAEHAEYVSFFDYAQNHPEDVFVLPFRRYKNLAKSIESTYKAVTPGSWNNIFSTGYWNIYLPSMEGELHKRGVDNVFRDIVNENVYVMNDDRGMGFKPFYFDHYHQKLKIDTVQSFGNLQLLKYQLKGNAE